MHDHCECSKILATDQHCITKRYCSGHVGPFMEQLSMLDDAIAVQNIAYYHKHARQYTDELLQHELNVQLNEDSQSYS